MIESVAKAFKLLTLVNEHPGATLSELAKFANHPRGTAFRILNTLCRLSIIRQCNKPARYYVTSNALSLTRGVHEQQATWETIAEALESMNNTAIWPVVFTVPKGEYMEIVYSSCDQNPRALKRPKCGEQLPIALSATGRVYLTACEPARIVNRDSVDLLHGVRLNDVRRQGLRTGYCVNDKTQTPESVLAVPVVVAGRPVGALGMRFITSAVTAGDVHDRLLPDLCALRDAAVREAEKKTGLAV